MTPRLFVLVTILGIVAILLLAAGVVPSNSSTFEWTPLSNTVRLNSISSSSADWTFEHVIIDDNPLATDHMGDCEIVDINGDGNLDIFVGEMGNPGAGDQARTFIWYGDGRGKLRETVVSSGQGIHEGVLSDLYGDGDIDILMKPYNHNAPRLDVLLNPER